MTRHRTTGSGLAEFDKAVLGSVHRGVTDPVRIVANLMKRNGDAWLHAMLAELVVEVAEQRARDLVRSCRLNAEAKASRTAKRAAAARPRAAVAERIVSTPEGIDPAELADVPVHIPGRGWVTYGVCSSDDMRARRDMYVRLAGRNSKKGTWCGEVADRIDAEQVGTLIEVSWLPPFPNGESAEEMGDEAVSS